MTRAEFHNALRVLLNLDLDELVKAGVFVEPETPIEKTIEQRWQQFKANPHLFFIRCDDRTCKALWTLMETRLKNSREGIFVLHNCVRCNSGKLPCINGSPSRCEYPRARND